MNTEIVRWALYATLFLAIVLVVEGAGLYLRDIRGAKRRINKRMDLMNSGATTDEILSQLRRVNTDEKNKGLLGSVTAYIERQLSQAGSTMSGQRMLVIMGAATVGIGIGFPLLLGLTGRFKFDGSLLLILVFAGFLGIGLPMLLLNFRAAKRMKKFEAQFPVALDIFVRGLRAGHPVPSALELLTSEMPDPIGTEFGIVIDEVNYGLDLRDALENLALRAQTPDVQMFVVCVSIQAETGGNLAEILESLSKVIRERASMVLKVRALASEGKMSGIMLSILPVFTFVTTFAGSPKFYLDAVDDPLFMPVAVALLVWYFLGVFSIRKLVDLKV